MIKLMNILRESTEQKGYSWLNPDGKFIPIKYSHGSDARNIRWNWVQNKNNFVDKEDHIFELWKLGWQRITNSEWMKKIFTHNELHPPNPLQLRALINLAIESESEYVEWDGGDVGEKILWSSHDTLEEEA